jgi:hypothetical protein
MFLFLSAEEHGSCILSRFRGLRVIYRRVSDWIIGFIDHLYTPLGTTSNYSAIVILHTLQFTVTHALGFSIFTSRILATDLQQSHYLFKSHMKPSFHGLSPFLPLFWNCKFRKLDSVQFLCSQAHIMSGWPLETRLTLLSFHLHYNNFARTTQKTQLSIIAKACLQRHCISTEVWLRSRCSENVTIL